MMQLAHAAAAHRGGIFLESTYLGQAQKHRWRCARGHEWQNWFDSVVRRGRWCQTCKDEDLVMKAHDAAQSRGGRLVSLDAPRMNARSTWECARGHVWSTRVERVLAPQKPTWCASCQGLDPDGARLIASARKRAKLGGALLLECQYMGLREKYQLRCRVGHNFELTLDQVLQRRVACPHCDEAEDGPAARLLQSKQYAAERGGKVRPGKDGNLAWQCAERHQWTDSYAAVVLAGRWCKTCSEGYYESRVRNLFELLLPGYMFPSTLKAGLRMPDTKRPLELDGYCAQLNLAFEFQGPHHFEVLPQFAQTEDHLLRRRTIDEHKRVQCAALGIRLIEVHFRTPVRELSSWLHHRISAWPDLRDKCEPPAAVQLPVWVRPNRWTLVDLQSTARSRGGRCLSSSYFGARANHDWECGSCGHQWPATWDNVRQGSWCPPCGILTGAATRIARGGTTIETLRRLAASRNGACLSNIYSGTKQHYNWLCHGCGRRWPASWANVGRPLERGGTWCGSRCCRPLLA